MRYVAAYLLALLGDKGEPTSADIQKILSSVAVDCDSEKLNKVVSELKGKSVEEVIAAGQSKLATMPSGGGAVAKAAVADPAAAEKKVEKVEAKPESESEDEDMGFGLFD